MSRSQEPDPNAFDGDEPTGIRDLRKATGTWAKEMLEKVIETKDDDNDVIRTMMSSQVDKLQDLMAEQGKTHVADARSKDRRIMGLFLAMLLGWGAFTVMVIVLFAYLAGFRGDVDVDLKTGAVKIEASGEATPESKPEN